MLELFIKVLLSYLLGSLIGSLIVGRLKGGVDIRESGSGNAGGTNALRTQGKFFAFWVMLIDVGKGVLAVAVVAHLPLPLIPDAAFNPAWLAAACGFAVVAGHVWPVFFGFRGGKGMATFLGVLAVVSWPALVTALIAWALVIMLTGYVGLATMIAAVTVPVYALLNFSGLPLLVFGVAMALFIIYTHRSNIARLRAGNENRFEKAMLLHRLIK